MGIQKRLRRQRVKEGLEQPLRHDHSNTPFVVVKSYNPTVPEGTKVFRDHYETPDGRKLDLHFNPIDSSR